MRPNTPSSRATTTTDPQQGDFSNVNPLLIPFGFTAWIQHIDSTSPDSTLTVTFRNGISYALTLQAGTVIALDGDYYSAASIPLSTVNTRWALLPNCANGSPLGASVPHYLYLVSSSNKPIPVAYNGVGPPPTTGVWRGYAVASTTGDVSILSIGGGYIHFGPATEAAQSFSFAMGVTESVTPTLVNCTVQGGMVSL